MGFAGYQAALTGIPMDEDGMLVDELVERFAGGYRPKFVYVIPEYQNPSGRTLSLGAPPRAGRRVPRATAC